MAQATDREVLDAVAEDTESLADSYDQLRADVAALVTFAQALEKMFKDVAPMLSMLAPGLKVPGLELAGRKG